MTGQSFLRKAVALVAAVVCLALFASCTSSPANSADDSRRAGHAQSLADEGTASEPQDDPGDSDDPGDPDNTGQDELRDVPPLELPSGPVGTAQAYDELIARLEPFVTEEQQAAGVPWPDLRNPDPVVAYQGSATFQQWMMQNNSSPPLTEAYTAPNSPERQFDLQMFDSQHRLGLLFTPDDPPYSMRIEAVVHPAATSITDALLAQVPAGSAAIVYFDSSGSSSMITESGNVVSQSPGWTNLGPWVAIMEPTDVGWQVWWDELTDPLPPGQDYDRGPAALEDKPRTKA